MGCYSYCEDCEREQDAPTRKEALTGAVCQHCGSERTFFDWARTDAINELLDEFETLKGEVRELRRKIGQRRRFQRKLGS
jgi:NMD protein affecting ribosome stability and mRNA decay